MKLNFDELVKQEIIDFRGKSLDDDLEVIIKVLGDEDAAVKKLYLSCTNFTLADGKFTDVLAENNTLEEIHLYYNAIGAEGTKCLAAALAKNKTLKVLDLMNNNIGVEGAKYLAEALKVNTTLETIYLLNNNIGDEGVKHLARALMVNATLQAIDLATNSISDEGAKRLATALLLNQGICFMDLQHNKIGYQGAEKLVRALECNNNIKTLSLQGNYHHINDSRLEKISTIMKDTDRKQKKLTLLQWREINAMKDEEIANNVKAMVKQDRIIAKKDEEIASLKDSLVNSKPTIDTVDLTADDSELNNNKRPRTVESPKKCLASILLDEKSQKLVQVKQEKIAVETSLENVKGEKVAVERKMELALECKICFELKDETCALVPCGHIMCSSCVGSYTACPTCSRNIESRLRLYN